MRGVIVVWTVLILCVSVSAALIDDLRVPEEVLVVTGNASSVSEPFRVPAQPARPVTTLIEITDPSGTISYVTYRQDPVLVANTSLSTATEDDGFSWEQTYELESNTTYRSIDVVLDVPQSTSVTGAQLISVNGTEAIVRTRVPGTVTLTGSSTSRPGGSTDTFTYRNLTISANTSFAVERLEGGVRLSFEDGPITLTLSDDAYVMLRAGDLVRVLEPSNTRTIDEDVFSLDVYPLSDTIPVRALDTLPVSAERIVGDAILASDEPIDVPSEAEIAVILNRRTGAVDVRDVRGTISIEDGSAYDEDPAQGSAAAIVAFARDVEQVLEQSPARVGEPVRWTVRSDEGSVRIPANAYDVQAPAFTVQLGSARVPSETFERVQELRRVRSEYERETRTSRDYLFREDAQTRIVELRSRIESLEDETLQMPDPQGTIGLTGIGSATVSFTTPAPQIRTLERTDDETLVLVSSETHLANVEVRASVPSMDPSRMAVLWETNGGTRIPIEGMDDLDGDGLIDEVTFIAPHLSDQEFRIIEVAYAEEIDTSGSVVRDVTDLVIEQDDVSALIIDGHSVRATFESEIDYRGEMIVVANGSGSIDIREAGSSETIETIGPISDYDVYRTRLLDYTGSSDRFDFVVSGRVDIDLIIDPSAIANYDPSSDVSALWTCTGADCGTGNYAVLDDGNRSGDTVDTTTDYLSNGANNNQVEETGFPTITQAGVDYITLWTYIETGTNHEMTVLLQNDGTTQDTLVVSPGSSPGWRFANWSAPTGIGAITAEFSSVKNGGGGPTTGFVYAIYLEIGYTDNTAPTIAYGVPTTAAGNTTSTTIDVTLTASDPGGALDTIAANLYNATTDGLISSDSSPTSPLATSFTSLSDGDYYFFGTASDVATNTNNTATRYVTIDTTNPAITLVSPSETNDTWVARPWLAFNASVIDRNVDTIVFNLTNGTDGSLVGQQTSSTSPFFFNFTGLANDHYNFTAWVNDSAGNTNETQLVHVNVDTTPPSAQYVAPTEDPDALLNRSNVQVNVTASETRAEGLDTITIELRTRPGGTVVNTFTSAPEDTNLYANVTKADGLYAFNASASNKAGLVTTLATRNVTIDTTPPTLTVNSPLNNTKYLNDTVLIDVSTSDATTQVDTVWYFNGTANVLYTVANNITLADANYEFIFYANDTAGNLNSKLINFTVNTTSSDTNPPEITVISPIETTYDTSTISVNFTASDNVAVDSLWYFNSTDNTSYTAPELLTLVDGDYTLFFYANDTTGNNASANRSFTIDTTNPQIDYVPITTSDQTVSTDTFIEVNVSASDVNLAEVRIDVFNASDGSLYASENSTIGFFFNFTALPDADYAFNATATDDANNTNTTQTRSVTVDTASPTINYVPNTTPHAQNLSQSFIEVNVSASDTNLAEVEINVYNASDGSLIDTQNDTSGFFFNFTGLADGDYAFNATASDGAGLTTSTATRIVTLDTTMPTVAYVAPTETANSRLSRNYIMVNVTASDTHLDTITIQLDNSSGTYSIQTSVTSPFFFNFTGLPDGQYFLQAYANDSAGNVQTLTSRAVEILVNPTITFSGFYEPTTDIQIGWTCNGPSCVNGQWDALSDGDRNPDPADVNDYIRTTAGSGAVSEHSIDPITETEIETIRIWAYVQTGDNFQMGIQLENDGTPVGTPLTVPTSTTTGWVSTTWTNPGTPGTVSAVFTTTKNGGGPARNGDVYAWYIEVEHNDTIAPAVQFVPPSETNDTSIATASIDVNVTANDTQSGLANITIYLYNSSGALIDNATTITSPDYFSFTAPADGLYYFNATAYDLAGNVNVTETREVTVNRTKLSITDIIFEPVSPVEGQNVTARVNVSNAGPAANDVELDLNVSLWNGTWLLDEQLSDTFNITASGNTLVNFTWTAKVGTHNFSAYANPSGAIEENTFADNGYTENLSVSSWKIFYGQAESIATILSGGSSNLFNWNVGTPEGVILYADADASFFMWNLEPLNGTSDLSEADAALGSTYYNDSIADLFDTDGNSIPDDTSTFRIGSRDVANVPVTNTIATNAFVTGLMWDSADGGSEYDGSQDIIIITRFNASQVGSFGTYDYEVRVPVGLESIIAGVDQVQRVFDLR